MDTFPGMQFEPLSLHKYLYTHADPVNGIDPSGYFSITEYMTAQNIGLVAKSVAVGSLTGAIFGAIDASLSRDATGEAILNAAVNGAIGGAILGPLSRVKSLQKALIGVLGVATVVGTADSVSNGNYLQGGFRAISGLLSSYFYLRSTSFISDSIVPRIGSFSSPQGFSGVWSSTRAKIAMRPSTENQPIPNGWVDRSGGHRTVADEFFPSTNREHLFGFTVIKIGNNTVKVEFFSRSMNGNYPGNLVPEPFRPLIVQKVAKETGMTVLE